MDSMGFDRLARALADGVSRRGVLKRFAATTVAGPMALVVGGVAADGDDKNNDRNNRDRNRCRANGENCDGGQECCSGLSCQPAAVGNSLRCQPRGGGAGAQASTTTNSTTNQTINNTAICTGGDCAIDQNAEASSETNQTAQTTAQQGSPGASGGVIGGFGRLPGYTIDVDCRYEEVAYQTTCVAIGNWPKGAPVIRDITLPSTEICAIVIDEIAKPPKYEEIVTRRPVEGTGGGGGVASAGSGGTANADASGGTVSIGDVSGGGNNVNVSASGGTANADASGGSGNVAIAGGAQEFEEIRELQLVEPGSLTLVLEGNVVTGRQTTWWLDTEAGRLPALGPALTRAEQTTPGVGAIAVDAFACPLAGPEDGFDWFAQCFEPAAPLSLNLVAEGGTTPAASGTTNERGRAYFGGLQPGRYRLEPQGGAWCRAESDGVDEAGNLLVESGRDTHVWLFTCTG